MAVIKQLLTTTTTPGQQSPFEPAAQKSSVMAPKTQPSVNSVTEDLSNIVLSPDKSNDSTNTKPDDITDNKVSPTKIDDFFDIKLSTGNSNYLADTKAPTNRSHDLFDTKDPDGKSEKKKCTNCGNMAAKSHCAGCYLAPNVDSTIHDSVQYCTRECQKAHWSAHRVECKNLQARKALFRAASLLQKMWYAIRRESFDTSVVKVEEIDGTLMVYEGDYDVESDMREGGFYRKFPEAIFENKEDAESCLSLLYCNDSMSHMHQAVEWLLNGICRKITECLVKVTKPIRPTRYARDEWDLDWFHNVLKVVLPSGEVYAIDLTGAQYGWYEPIIHWTKYIERCTQIIRSTREGDPLGSVARTMLSLTFSDARDDRTDMQRAIPMCGECLKLHFNQAFADFRKRYKSGPGLLRLPLLGFRDAEKEMLSMAKHVTIDTAEKIDALFPLILAETIQANQCMIENPGMPKGQVLAYHLIRLAASFNGTWERDAITGRLVSVSLKRAEEDHEYLGKLKRGILPEQKAWSDMTLLYE